MKLKNEIALLKVMKELSDEVNIALVIDEAHKIFNTARIVKFLHMIKEEIDGRISQVFIAPIVKQKEGFDKINLFITLFYFLVIPLELSILIASS